MPTKEAIYRVAFVGGTDHPIPALRGGAIQTLVTAILDKNEEQGLFQFDVYTCKDNSLNEVDYQYTRIFQLNHKSLLNCFWIGAYRVIRRLSGNKLPYKNIFMYQANAILCGQKYDTIIYETSDNEFLQVKHHNEEIVLFHIHSDYLRKNSYGIEKIVGNCDKFVAVSDFIKSQLELVTEDANKIMVLPNAIEVSHFREADGVEFRKCIREQYGITEDEFLFIYCSRLSPEKGCLELLQAFESVPNCKLIIVGGENFNSNTKTPYVQRLLEFAKKLKERVIFTGYVEHANVVKYMYAADAAVIPSVCNEAFSLTLLEFRACGLPTIASNIGGIPEVCDDKSTIKVDFGENFVENLSDAMIRIMNDDQMRTSMGRAAQNGLEQFDYDNYYRRFYEMIDALCGGQKDGNQSKEQ